MGPIQASVCQSTHFFKAVSPWLSRSKWDFFAHILYTRAHLKVANKDHTFVDDKIKMYQYLKRSYYSIAVYTAAAILKFTMYDLSQQQCAFLSSRRPFK